MKLKLNFPAIVSQRLSGIFQQSSTFWLRFFVVYGAQVLAAVAGISFSLVAANLQSPSRLGSGLFFLTIGTIIINLITAPLGMWFTRLDRISAASEAESLTVINVWSFVSCFFAISALPFFFLKQPFLGLFFIFLASSIFNSSFVYEWNACSNHKLYGFAVTITPVLRIAFIVALSDFTKFTHTIELSLVCASLASCFSIWLAINLFSVRHCQRSLAYRFNPNHIRSGKALALSMFSSSAIYSAYQGFDKIAMRYFWGDSKLGVLILCTQWSFSAICFLFQPVIAVIYPLILSSDRSLQQVRILRNPIQMVLVMVSLVVIVFSFNYLGKAVFPPAFVKYSPLLPIGALSGFFFMTGQYVSIYFSREGGERGHIASVLLPAVLGSLIMIPLIMYWGVSGALFGSLIFSSLYAVNCFRIALWSPA